MATTNTYFTVHQEGPVTVVKFTEKHLNDSNIQQIAELLVGITDQLGTGELHLDFSDVHYLSTAVGFAPPAGRAGAGTGQRARQQPGIDSSFAGQPLQPRGLPAG